MAGNPELQKAHQKLEETSGERKSRLSAHFPSVQAGLPSGTASKASLVDNLSSYLGRKNPLASEVRADRDEVWLIDNTAYRPEHPYPHSEQPWHADFVAAYFERQHAASDQIGRFVADIARRALLHEWADMPDDEGRKRIEDRIGPFVNPIAPARFVNVALPSGFGQKLGPGGRGGFSSQVVGPLEGSWKDGDVMQTHAVPDTVTPYGPMNTYFVAPEGWLVVSDIDDTVKVTMTPSPIGILRSTFISEPTPIAGMPELYAHVRQTLSDPAFFFLSASPYNLYPFLRKFLHAHYPPGSILLREASWMSIQGIMDSLTTGVQAYKVGRMDHIRAWLPLRRVLCVGDSTQSDPEAYGEIYRKYPGWVKAIFIRKVVDVAEMQHSDKNKPERFEKAFHGVPRSVWRVFEDPKELAQAVEALKTI